MSTLISWTSHTWNPVTGCSRVSEGCRFCYAERLSLRFGWSAKPWTAANATENIRLHPERLHKPYTLRRPARVFVNSMSDLFHPLVPDDFVAAVFAVMNDLPQHTFQILTKRPERAAAWPGPWTPNIWQGTSVEDRRALHRVGALRRCEARVRFLSCEPLIGPLGRLDLDGISWVIVGGESGAHMSDPAHPRRLRQEWARAVRNQCVAAGVPFFFKQDSGVRTEMRPWLVEEDGTRWTWHQYPGEPAPPIIVPVDG